ncbi:MAG: DUF4810 domain-containing protein [Pseudomonadota bacterium]
MCQRVFLITVSFLLLLSGCATPAKYNWGNYDRSLYSYYKDPTKSQEHMVEILNIIRDSEKTRGRVAPGIHAEYGYLLMQANEVDGAVTQFMLEKEKWPESAYLMDSMLKIAKNVKSNKPLPLKE